MIRTLKDHLRVFYIFQKLNLMLLEFMTRLFQKEIFRICGSFLSRTILLNHHFLFLSNQSKKCIDKNQISTRGSWY